jgi:hypothetical protein
MENRNVGMAGIGIGRSSTNGVVRGVVTHRVGSTAA